ncbi:hypothetical protein VOM14_19145 [Paraburkholderia sp. MPAMCS5]|uniref:hypothetical protein n=1 Tax=Paraburkholderia sp. MPAMCS5 TaxID=3112563 RepID=UPI002E173AD3|nr:hypothetical protein [Paraburkholderia sp. MPAMCS5]
MTSEPDETGKSGESSESARPTPPRQNPNDPTAGDRQLSDEQKQSAKNEPAPPQPGRGENLPDPKEVGEAG